MLDTTKTSTLRSSSRKYTYRRHGEIFA
jgi:hypothetical protein